MLAILSLADFREVYTMDKLQRNLKFQQDAIERMKKFVAGNNEAKNVVQHFLDTGYDTPSALHITCKVLLPDYLRFRNSLNLNYPHKASYKLIRDWEIALDYIGNKRKHKTITTKLTEEATWRLIQDKTFSGLMIIDIKNNESWIIPEVVGDWENLGKFFERQKFI